MYTATSPFHPVSSHCWFTSSSLELVQLFLSLLEGNNLGAKCKPSQANQPTNLAPIPVQGIHTPPVTGLLFFLLWFSSSFLWTRQTIGDWYSLEKLRELFSFSNQTICVMFALKVFLHPHSGKRDELKTGLQAIIRLSVVSTSIATEKRAWGTELCE